MLFIGKPKGRSMMKPMLCAPRSTCWTHSHIGSTRRTITIWRPRTLRCLFRRQINRPLAATIATPATSTQRRLFNLQRSAINRTRAKAWLQRFGTIHRTWRHRPTIFYGMWHRITNDTSTCIDNSHFRTKSNRSSRQPSLSRAHLYKTS